MKIFRRILLHVLMVCAFALHLNAQSQSTIIHLYNGKAPGSETWQQHEAVYYDSTGTKEHFVYNVTEPTITVFPADSIASNGTAVIVCPGGAFHVLGIDNEGYNVAHWLNSIGITAFVLKYRLAETKTNQPLKELSDKLKDIKQLDKENAPVVPLAIDDANAAIKYVRQHAASFHINPHKIGIIGFSAGGTVTAGVAFNYSIETRPDFVAPIYAYLGALKNFNVPVDAPPLFVAACTDDGLGFAPYSIQMYNYWLAAKKNAELHIFSKGGHGFGMKTQHLPVDEWRSLFESWLRLNQFL